MRFVFQLLSGSLLNIEIDTDGDTDESEKPPFGFAGSGSGLTETTDDTDPMVDRPGYTIDRH